MINTHTTLKAPRNVPFIKNSNRMKLKEQVEKGLSSVAIAALWGCNRSTINRVIKKFKYVRGTAC